MDGKYIKDKIENSIPKTTAEVTGDGTHFEATVVSVAFEGKSTLERNKMVYSALREEMVEDIHALSLKTFSPEEFNEG